MGIDLAFLLAIALAYLAFLFIIAWCADSGWLPDRLVHSPIIYSLSLGVYATSWTYYGSVGLADSSGFAFLTIYLGLTGAFILGPHLLKPILRLCQDYQLTSIADLLAFRYGGRTTGLAVTVFMLVGILPYISLQIRAVTESIQILSRQVPPNILALVFCITLSGFAILFGARHLTPREKHNGLVVAIAFESAVKLVAMAVAGMFVVTQVFDSPMAMSEWANLQSGMVKQLYTPSTSGLWSTLLLLAFCAAFLLPRQFHMTFTENQNPSHLRTAYWLFPLYLLILNLPIIPILFAGRHLSLSIAPDFYVLGMTLTLGREWLAVLVFLGGLSAASAMMIVTTLALSSMCMNYLLLPATLAANQSVNQERDFYKKLLRSRRLVITAIIAAGYGFYIVIELNEGLASLGLISFVAAAQLLPGIIGLLFWPRATQAGFITGLAGGALIWFGLLILPLIESNYAPSLWSPIETDIWTLATFCTLSVNGILFVAGSFLTHPSDEEIAASQAANEQAELSGREDVIARSVIHYRYSMQQALGNKVASQELERAMLETRISEDETRGSELRVLHEQLERNLTGLLGPTLARDILRRKPSGNDIVGNISPDARLLERRLETSREQMRGLTKQVDDLRQYLRDVLRQLPLGVCSVAANGRIYIWNSAMQMLTGIEERDAYDKSLNQLNPPWGELLAAFAISTDNHQFRCRAMVDERGATVNLHKADIGIPEGRDDALAGVVILMEDRTQLDSLEAELAHTERLASVGRLAAGVAHEIGNPLTGIASIAQNLHQDVTDMQHSTQHSNLGPAVIEQTDDILIQVERINSIVKSLLTFSHADSIADTPPEPVHMADCIREAIRLVQLSPETRHIKFELSIPENARVLGDASLLMQVFVNLINNACDASPEAGVVRLNGQLHGDDLTLEIVDQGEGVDDLQREKIFEPFFTTKPVGQGTGLGLSLAYSIVGNHQGRLRIGDADTGTKMIVTLPQYQAVTD